MTTRALTGVDPVRREMFLLVAQALADRDARVPTGRFADLVARLAVSDEVWLMRSIGWMTRHAELRRLRLAALAELAHAWRQVNATGARKIIDRALQRADEPGELLAYWISRYGNAIPKPVKRGVADATVRLYDELALTTYDGPGAALRFADVLALTHPAPRGETQSAVFRHAVARRRGITQVIPESMPLLRARRSLYQIATDRRVRLLERPDAGRTLSQAAMSWQTTERWLLGAMTGPAWAALLPSMPYQDRLDHLPDFDRTGVPDEIAGLVAAELAEPALVTRAGVTPLELFAALRAVPGSRWSRALRQAMNLATVNVPALPGRTLVVVDRTKPMAAAGAAGAPLTRADAAAVFGGALALRATSADLIECGTATARIANPPGTSLTRLLERFGPVGGAADIAGAVRDHLDGHDRIVILTHPDAARSAVLPSQAHIITGVDRGWFIAIPHLEMARTGDWPF
jgi:hypothetical protein